MAEITEFDSKSLLEQVLPLIGDDKEGAELINGIGRLLTLPDPEFEIFAPIMMQKFQQAINNPNDKIVLAQAANANGFKVEDFTTQLEDLTEDIEKSSLSRIKRSWIRDMLISMINVISDTEGIAKKMIRIPIELLSENIRMPEYAHSTDSGMDVFAPEEFILHPGEKRLIPCGFKVALPPGYELQVRPKSGRALKTQMRIANTPGTIDQGYRDEVGIIVENIDVPIKDITIDDEGKVTSILYGSDVSIGKGEKFAQLVLAEVPKIAWYEVDSVLNLGEDRGGGFGSTGLM